MVYDKTMTKRAAKLALGRLVHFGRVLLQEGAASLVLTLAGAAAFLQALGKHSIAILTKKACIIMIREIDWRWPYIYPFYLDPSSHGSFPVLYTVEHFEFH